jgi:transmembrane sensor
MKEAQDRALSAIGDTASEWVVLLHGPDATAAEKAAFMDWLRMSPVHVQEFLRAEATFIALAGAACHDRTDVRELLEQVPANVVEIGGGIGGSTEVRGTAAGVRSGLSRAKSVERGHGLHASAVADQGAPRARRRRSVLSLFTGVSTPPNPRSTAPIAEAGRSITGWAIAAVLLLAVGVALVPRAINELHTQKYTTATGEQRRIVLADGSTIDLNTRSEVRVHLTDTARKVDLRAGEAYFSVAKDPVRPFTVSSGDTVVRAVGTRFNVYRQDSQTTVTVIEGSVVVADGEMLNAGHRAEVAAKHITQKPVAVPERDIAWRERRLIFEDRTIADVVAEFNRYNTRKIVIEDADLAGERINGVFDADKPQNLLDFVVRNTGAHVEERGDGVVVTRAASSR